MSFYNQIVQWRKYLGKVIFTNEVDFQNVATLTGLADLTLTDDLVVGDDAAVGGDLAVTGSITSVGGVTSPLVLTAAKHRIYTGTKTLTEAGGVETVFTITNATTQATSVVLNYSIKASDGTDHQVSTGVLVMSMVNKAGTVTATILPADIADGVTAKTAVQALSAGTATAAFAFTAASNAAAFTVNIDSSLTTTSASMEWVATVLGPGTLA